MNMISKRRVFNLIFVTASIFFITSCSKTENATNITDSSSEKTLPKNVSLQKINFKQWDKQLKSYQPNIVVVDAWAMWCSSCIKRFPKMVELSKKYQNENVKFVSLNLDDHTNTEAVTDAEAFLHKMNATFDNFHIDENLIDAFERFNLIGIPAVFIYDKNSKEQFRLTGDNPNSQFTEKDIEASVIELLKST
ncbi:MAG: TlpA family protein disulfide reductase [Cellvibrionaceae bacterium]